MLQWISAHAVIFGEFLPRSILAANCVGQARMRSVPLRRIICRKGKCCPPITDPYPRTHFPMPDATIHTTGEVLEHPGPQLYRVALPNGKIILAHLSKTLAEQKPRFENGMRLLLELTPYDFETARILGPADSLADAEAAENHA
jgi:translation initiation factor IF-1